MAARRAPGAARQLPGAGLIPGTGDRYETVLRRIGSADSHVIGFAADGERFSIEAGLDQMPFFGSAIPLRDGEWNLYVRPVGGGPDTLAEIKYDHDRLGDVTGQRVPAGRKQYRLVVTGHNDPVITAEPQLRRVEQGNFGQRALRRGFYPAMLRSAPVRERGLLCQLEGQAAARTTRSASPRNCAAAAMTASTCGPSPTGRCRCPRAAPGCSAAPRSTTRRWPGRST